MNLNNPVSSTIKANY